MRNRVTFALTKDKVNVTNDERRDRIMDVAIDLAIEGGYDNVRQRDVAAAAGVALGTLYKAFRSKEEILVAAVARQAKTLEARFSSRVVPGATPLERVGTFYESMTRAMCRKPQYAKSVLRAMASGEPEITANLESYRAHINRMTVAALRGVAELDPQSEPPTPNELELSYFLQDVWFSVLVGWSAGLNTQAQVVQHMRSAAKALIKGLGL
jgi:AcrR family transcriptional regulator